MEMEESNAQLAIVWVFIFMAIGLVTELCTCSNCGMARDLSVVVKEIRER